MAKQTLDLYELFQLVVSKGGLVEVINKKLWREVTKGLNLPSSITSAAFTLRTQLVSFFWFCWVIVWLLCVIVLVVELVCVVCCNLMTPFTNLSTHTIVTHH